MEKSKARAFATAVVVGVLASFVAQSILTRLPKLQAVVLGQPPPAGT